MPPYVEIHYDEVVRETANAVLADVVGEECWLS